MPRKKKIPVTTRLVFSRHDTFEEAAAAARKARDRKPNPQSLWGWEHFEVCYWPAKDLPHTKRGCWSVEGVMQGGKDEEPEA